MLMLAHSPTSSGWLFFFFTRPCLSSLAAAVSGAPALCRARDPAGQTSRAGNASLRGEQLVEARASETPAATQPHWDWAGQSCRGETTLGVSAGSTKGWSTLPFYLPITSHCGISSKDRNHRRTRPICLSVVPWMSVTMRETQVLLVFSDVAHHCSVLEQSIVQKAVRVTWIVRRDSQPQRRLLRTRHSFRSCTNMPNSICSRWDAGGLDEALSHQN